MSSSSLSPSSSRMALLVDEEMEPYVRKKKNAGESRSKMIGLNDEEQNLLRTSINSRERRRMHDLNDAHEELRSCLPYGQEANSRRLSKISTIMLASNWIRQLTKENQRLKSEVEELQRLISPSASTSSPKMKNDKLGQITKSMNASVNLCDKNKISSQENVVPKPTNLISLGSLNNTYGNLPLSSSALQAGGNLPPHNGTALIPILNFPLHCLKMFGQPCLCIGCVSSGTSVPSAPSTRKDPF
ncbi:unnamed protein product [Auanema sp. JU1783]|nr:unnamed protein product [Auanema sp. JU1783]